MYLLMAIQILTCLYRSMSVTTFAPFMVYLHPFGPIPMQVPPASCVEIEDLIPLPLTNSEEFQNSVLDKTDVNKLHVSPMHSI